ncbi:hypothetical protein J0910_23595 [Nocardiopsis sp. CNT-189]|uniref:hypothetical protein n=1 Tax=Nocardiopsis oceanisediminis TaxID=2816862 RepID=UPI003B385BFC
MKWLLKRVLAACAAVLVVAVAAGALLGMRFSGEPAAWAASGGENGAWLSASWLSGERSAADRAELRDRIARGGIAEVYVQAGEIGADGSVQGAYGSAEARDFLAWAEEELPETAVLGRLRHRADGSSLVEDRFDEEARARVAAAAGEAAGAGFDGVHLDVSPVSVNDPSMPRLLDAVREEIGGDSVLSVQALPVELVPGLRVPYFAIDRGERYWSKGYLRRIAERADIVVVPGHGSGMPVSSMYGGYMVRQVEEAVAALEQREGSAGTALRFGVPGYGPDAAGEWGEPSGGESTETAVQAVRIGLTRADRRENVGTALYPLDTAHDAQWRVYLEEWVEPAE